MFVRSEEVRKRLSYSTILASLSAVILLPGMASSQEPVEESEFRIEEIVVTAQKREQRLRDIPISVSVLGAEELNVFKSGGGDIRALTARVPSLQIDSTIGRTFPRFFIRGLGNTDFDINASQPVAYIYDEVVMENALLKGFPAFDVERIEVLRGPQGTLFGRNTPAGIVKLDSRKPTHTFEGYATARYGRFETAEFEGAVGGPIVQDVLAFRASTLMQIQGDHITNKLPDKQPFNEELGEFDDIAMRLQLLYTPSEDFSALFNFHKREQNGEVVVFQANTIKPGGGLIDDFQRDEVFHDGEEMQDLSQNGAMLRLEYDFGPVALTSITGYEHVEMIGRGDVDGGFGAAFLGEGNFGPGLIPFPSETADGTEGIDQWTQEVRLSSNELGMFDFQIGFFFFDETVPVDSFSFDTLGGGAVNGRAFQLQETTSWAVFGSADVELTPQFTLSGGVRFTDEKKDYFAERTLSPVGGGPLPKQFRNPEDEVVSWDVSATYDATEDVTFYTRAAKSFRAPSIQGRVLFADDVTVGDTEEIFSVEGGLKGLFLDGRLRLDLAGYWWDMDNQQLTAVGGDANINRIVNVADTTGAGAEFSAEWSPTNNLRLTGALSYNFTELNDPNLRTAPCGAPCTITDPIVVEGGRTLVDINNNNVDNAPRWIANWTARYRVPIDSNSEVYAFTDWAVTGAKDLFLFESPEFRTGERVEGGLRLGYRLRTEVADYDFAVWGRNINDETALVFAINFNNLTGIVNRPPLYGLEMSVNF